MFAVPLPLALDPLPLLRRMLGRPLTAAPVAVAAAPPPRTYVTRLLAVGVPAGRTVALPVPEGPVVAHCRRGEVWLTYDGDPRDLVLRAGECCPLERREGVMAHALRGHGIVELETMR